jgi:hypothetical protein
MDLPNKDEIIAKARAAQNTLDAMEPFFRIVETYYTEKLVAITGWKAWWRGDLRRAEAIARIHALRDVRTTLEKTIQAGVIAATPPRGMRL